MNARPYAVQMQRVLGSVAARVDPSIHPLLTGREPRAGQPDAGDRRHRRQGAVRQLQHQRHQGRRRVHRRAAAASARSGWSAARAATSSAAAASTVLFEQIGIFQKLQFDDAQAIAQAGDRGVHLGRGRSGDAGLQRVQVGDVAAGRRRSAAADSRARTSSAGGAGAPPGADPASRRSTTCTSRRRRRSSISCCRATSRCRSTARCSSRTPRSSPRR